MSHWISFASVVGVQFLALVIVEFKERALHRDDRDSHSIWQAAAAGVASGLVLGIVFDELIGRGFQLFEYYIHSPTFIILNGALSYGLAVATALRFSPRPIRIQPLPLRRGLVVLGSTSMVFLGLALWLPGPLTLAAAIGCIVIAADEATEVCALGTVGPILEIASGSLRHVAHNWTTAALVGCIYEIGNYFFPVWRWWFTGDPATPWFELTIVVFGYVVLFHFCRMVGFVSLALMRRIARPHH